MKKLISLWWVPLAIITYSYVLYVFITRGVIWGMIYFLSANVGFSIGIAIAIYRNKLI